MWIGGSAPVAPSLRNLDDDMLLKFDNKGKFLLQIGGRSVSKGNVDTKSVHQSADVFVWPKTNEAFVADGYGNRRVIVFDADTGAFKRQWGAFGNTPIDVVPAPRGGGAGARRWPWRRAGARYRGARDSPQFGGPTHGVKVSNDGLVYVADRPNRRVQVFTPEGKYITQVFINRAGPSPQSAAGRRVLPRRSSSSSSTSPTTATRTSPCSTARACRCSISSGSAARSPATSRGCTTLAVDSKGNIYTGEVAPGARAQRFVYKGLSTTLPPNALTPAQLSATPAATAQAGQEAARAPLETRAGIRRQGRRVSAIPAGPARWPARTT